MSHLPCSRSAKGSILASSAIEADAARRDFDAACYRGARKALQATIHPKVRHDPILLETLMY